MNKHEILDYGNPNWTPMQSFDSPKKDEGASETNTISWFPRCRLAWLERRAKATGHIGRSDIMGAFGISAAHASNDLQSYLALNPGALTYHTSRKHYEWTGKKLAINPAPWGDFPL